ncbi:MAG: hypothetical protein JHC30_06250 [Caldisericum sp.]|jgi:hypothetical protein|nr:hypothetical protein [Caldisericum sp.]
MRISKRDPFQWFLSNFGVGGVSNYTDEQVRDILKALRLILENAGYTELEWLGKFLMKLSDYPKATEKFLDALIELGY